MKKWIKKDNRRKSQIFICPKCKRECVCINYDGKINTCNYRYCPHCGKKIER